jgi:hypothetical protein
MVPVLVGYAEDLHRNVPRRRVELELIEHGPAQNVRQEYV